ncbi:MAG: prepilin-type N-terminal cleavage/methylation domain-containing protein [Dehalococcoidales bacterium]|nr:prepilin-type N-terminal cleavage/methylation domain-containing protein [Dehalococcoidales bacterium]
MRLPKRGEKGFTLIELLIVVAILGVLAAIVIPNVGRFIGRGKTEAAATELKSIQSAVLSMMTDQGLPTLPAGTFASGTNITNNMSAFPGVSPYSLYGNTWNGSAVNYVASLLTKGTYSVDALGTVTQNLTGY